MHVHAVEEYKYSVLSPVQKHSAACVDDKHAVFMMYFAPLKHASHSRGNGGGSRGNGGGAATTSGNAGSPGHAQTSEGVAEPEE
jgi:hypothetical protein